MTKTYKTAAIAKQIASKLTKQTGREHSWYGHVNGSEFEVFDVAAFEAEQEAKKAAAKSAKKKADPVPNSKVYDLTEIGRQEILNDAKAYFAANYDFDGNDIALETISDDEMLQMIAKSTKLLGAVMNIRWHSGCKAQAAQRAEIKAEAF